MSERLDPSSSDTARIAVTALQATARSSDPCLSPTMATPNSNSAVRAPSEMPQRVGRFAILRELGAGGMGVVYAAYDEQLDRKVAVKLVRTEIRDQRPEATRRQMLREAQAMAKVEHPSVITVYEVGTYDDQIFVAMELVTGGDLRTWMTSAPRSWRDVLKICLQAGEGLAAAHRAGLVHRDFKPDNVLVGSDGRVRVTDFGLARPVFASDGGRPDVPADLPIDRLTRTGALIGTPAYMAPEQHRAEPADARSDQFAFCVTVWEALFGERPFAGATYAMLATNVLDGAVREPPKGNKVPARVRAALRRGLMPAPEDRFPSMDSLLAALSNQQGKKLLLAGGAGLLVIAAVGTTWAITRQPAASDATCPDPAAKLAGVWDPARRDAFTHALATVGPFREVAQRAAAGLDAYAEKWAQSWLDACKASRERGEQTASLFDLRVTCLGKRLKDVEAVVTALATTKEPAFAARAAGLVESLVPITQCNDAMSLLRVPPPPAAARATIDSVDADLDKVLPLKLANRYADARKLLDHAIAETQRAAYRPREATALFALGQLQSEIGENPEAEKNLVRASSLALAAQDDFLAAQAFVELVGVVGYNMGRPAEAHRWNDLAKASLERVGDPPQIKLKLLGAFARVLLLEGKHDDAMTTIDQAIAIAEKREDSVTELVALLSTKEVALFDLGHYDDAKLLVNRMLDLVARIAGPQHPSYGDMLESRANIYFVANEWDLGIADLKQSRAIKIASLGPDTSDILQAEANLGVVAGELGDWPEALRAARAALVMQERQGGPEHPDAAKAHANIGNALTELGRFEDAEVEISRALTLHERAVGAEHVDYGVDLQHMGALRLAQRRWHDAASLYERAKTIFVKALGAEHPQVAYATSGLGRAQLALGETRAARNTLEATMQSLDQSHVDPFLAAQTRLALADATWRLGERAAAIAISAKAEPDLAPLPASSNKPLRARIAAWRAAHH